MYSRKNVGPKIEPSGTPLLTGNLMKTNSHPEPPEAVYY